jgi:LmbE family N-acetylglucosaminyl deacetylase
VPFVDPVKTFRGVIVIAAPHMDDEILSCGGTIARLPDKDRVHCVYATDGSKSPAPIFPWLGAIASDLVTVWMREAKRALGILGFLRRTFTFACCSSPARSQTTVIDLI